MLAGNKYKVNSEETYQQFVTLFDRVICRKPNPEERAERLAWLEDNVIKTYVVQEERSEVRP